MKVFFCGASGSGKTTLAKYVNETFGLPILPSASRSVMQEIGMTTNEYIQLIQDQDKYFDFQRRVYAKQIALEYAAENTGFVSDRSFDHMVYTAMYGKNLHKIIETGGMKKYLKDMRNESGDRKQLVFFIRPTLRVWLEAKRQNDRDSFLVWDHLQQFDGAINFILQANNISHISIQFSDLVERHHLVSFHLVTNGIRLKDA